MKVSRLLIENFRGIRKASLFFPDHMVLIGDNNTGKSTVLEALDLALGPDRLSRQSPIDEHDFHLGAYLGTPGAEEELPRIAVEVTVTGLSEEQRAHFNAHIESWNASTNDLYAEPDAQGLNAADTTPALRVTFVGQYDPDEDDFVGRTYFTTSLEDGGDPEPFSKRDKQRCGFLYLRSVRTGTRALSLERGSLLDIILRLKEIRPQMWEETLSTLADFDIGSDPEQGLSGILESVERR